MTMDERQPQAEAVVVNNGRIDFTGTLQEARAFCGSAEQEEIRFEDGALFPGFIDTHSHASLYAQCRDQLHCDVRYETVDRLMQGLREHAASHPHDEWVRGYCYDDTGMKDCRHLTRHDLDAACPDRPVLVAHITCHLGYLNTLGLRRLGITADTRVEGGVVCLGADGQPDGLVKEKAFMQVLAQTPSADGEAYTLALEQSLGDYNRQGFTMFQDGGIGLSGNPCGLLQAYNQLAREDRMTARAYLHFMPPMMDDMLQRGLWNIDMNQHVYYGGVKYFSDGSIQSLTAVLNEPYLNTDFCGDVVTTPEDMAAIILKYHSQGVPVAIHANGDKAIEDVIRGFEAALTAHPRRVPGHMIIHVQMASDAQLARLKACGVTPTFFVRHVHAWGDRHVERFLGEERAARLDPLGSCVRLGMPFALHVDTPVQPIMAIQSIHTAVNRTTSGGRLLGPDQRVSALEAVKAYTVYAAQCCARSDVAGRIAPGLFADFVHLSENPLRVAPENIQDITVRHTVCNGKIVYAEKNQGSAD